MYILVIDDFCRKMKHHAVRIELQVYHWSNGLVVKVLDSQFSGPMFKTTGWVDPNLTQPVIILRLIKKVPGNSGNLVVKSKLPP